MIKKILDLHIHSKYSRACSKKLELPLIAEAAVRRGIDILATGDMTHPQWFEHIKETVVEVNEGVYGLKGTRSKANVSHPTFILGTEVASIKKHKEKTRRVHLLLFAPTLDVLETFNKELDRRGFNLTADGRPILGMPCKDILEMMLDIDQRMVMIPAHAWTPWFGIFGSKGGYDRLEDAFEDLTQYIPAVETGLSSDPLMNWRCSWLDNTTLISNSDAHSSQKLGREANVFQFEREEVVTYDEIMRIIREQDKDRFVSTIEFYPEEGKYHMDGHRDCGVVMHPRETKKHKGLCPSCRRPLVIGVMNRVEELADRTEEQARAVAQEKGFIPYKSIVPLPEIIADVFECGVATKRVAVMYDTLLAGLGSEFHILLHAPLEDIENVSGKEIRTAVDRVRKGEIALQPGYDGVFGTVKVFGGGEGRGGTKQLGLQFE